MSIIRKSILNADAEVRYLTLGELEQIRSFISSGERRLRLVQALSSNRDRIVRQAGLQLFQIRPSVVAPGGNAYGEEMTALCLRDLDYYLRLITYSVAVGEVTPIVEIGVVGVQQMYNSLGTPVDAVAVGIRAMKEFAVQLVSAEDASEVGFYFDYLINALK